MGLTDDEQDFIDMLKRLSADQGERADAFNAHHATLRERGQLGRYALHRYMCSRGCQIAIIYKYAGLTLCGVSSYKYSPGLNDAKSTARARERNTLDGNRHWPGHVYDLEDLARCGPDANLTAACRHVDSTIIAAQALALVDGVRPGSPGRPTIIEKSSQ